MDGTEPNAAAKSMEHSSTGAGRIRPASSTYSRRRPEKIALGLRFRPLSSQSPPHTPFTPLPNSVPSLSFCSSIAPSTSERSQHNSLSPTFCSTPSRLKRKAGSPNLAAVKWAQQRSFSTPPSNPSGKEPEFLRHPHHVRSRTAEPFVVSLDILQSPDRQIDRIDWQPTSPFYRASSEDAGSLYRFERRSQRRVSPFSPMKSPPPHRASRDSARSQTPSHGASVTRQSPRSTARASDASVSVPSHFTAPPDASVPTPPTSSMGDSNPKASTVYHWRGASFEFVNPHTSLRIQDIETPAELEGERSDYFAANAKRPKPPARNEREASTKSPVVRKAEKSSVVSTPPRSLFDDLPSAYSSITSRSSRKFQEAASPMNDMPLPPVPARVRQSTPHQSTSIESNPAERAETQPPKSSRSSSFMQRFSNVVRLERARDGRHTKRDIATDTFDETSAPGSVHSQNKSAQKKREAQHAFEDGEKSTSEMGSHTLPSDISEGQHYYDDSSLFGSLVRDSLSGSLHTPSLRPQERDSSHSLGLERNQSTSQLIDSYASGFGSSPHGSAASRASKKPSSVSPNPSRSDKEDVKVTESTITRILENYQNQDESTSRATGSPPPRAGKYASHPVSESNILNPTTTALEQFDFGLPKPGRSKTAKAKTISLPDERIRSATARALHSPVTPPPLGPLPPAPGTVKGETQSSSVSRDVSGLSESPSAISYGDTRHLLQLSSPSIEEGRGGSADNLSLHDARANDSLGAKASRAGESSNGLKAKADSLNVPGQIQRSSQNSLEDIMNRDIKYLSGFSGLESFKGSVYVVGNGSSTPSRDNSERKSQVPRSNGEASKHGNLPKGNPSPANASCVPVAAFPQSAVVPGIWRLNPSQREAFEKGSSSINFPQNKENRPPSGVSSIYDEGDDVDWETVADSRQTLGTKRTDDASLGDFSSYESLNTLRDVEMHPADNRFQHVYLLRSPPNSNNPMFVPSYDFGGVSFPNRNALTPPTPALYNTYKHPVPFSKTAENPFTSSPPQITGSPSDRAPFVRSGHETLNAGSAKESPHVQTVQFRRANLSVVHEQPDETTATKPQDYGSNWWNSTPVTPKEHRLPTGKSSDWFTSSQSLEVSMEAEQGSPFDEVRNEAKRRPSVLNSGVNATLLHKLRDGDRRMGSSPLSPSNSFAKFSVLGPKANITGTPNGTGMREAGSSLVGSSSPFPAAMYSSPPVFQSRVPLTPDTVFGNSPKSSPFPQDLRPSPKAYGNHNAAATLASPVDNRRRRLLNLTVDMDAGTARGLRRSVSGQRSLLEMSLATPERPDNPSRFYRTQTHSASSSVGTHVPLLPISMPGHSRPKLLQRYRSPSSNASEVRDRKQRLSWICLGLCSLLPFLLILYGHSALDPVIAWFTQGQIEHFGRRQKKWARVVGWSMAATTVLGIVIAFIVVRTVPNNIPR